MKNIRLGDVLIEFGYITPDQLNTALAYQKEHRDLRVGQALQELGYVNERQVLEALAQRLQLKMIDIEHTNVDVTAVEKVPQELAQKYDMLPIAQSPRALTIAANDPLNYYALEDIRQLTGLEPEIVLAELEPLRRAIRYYYAEVSARKAARTANDSDMAAAQTEDLAIDMTAEGGDLDAPIIRLLNSLVQRAVTTTASDIHIEPFEGETKVRMRIDGVIIDYVTLQRALHQPLIARIKIMSNLDIAEHRIPQDGHFRARLETGPDVNVRVSILPTVFGEKAVLRILSSNTYIKNANHFGMNDETYKRFLPLLNRPNGIVYLTGPTGSGKTTTLYMVLQTGIFAGRTEVRCPYARWGWTRGGGKVWHGGLDLAGLDDATIRMPYYKGKRITGRVTRARIVTDRRDKTWEWGYYVCVQLDRGQTPDAVNFLYFAHCASLLVKAGQRVASGDALAVMGNTGNAALADPPYRHCHLEVRAAAGGVGLDPTVYAGCENAVGVYGAAGRMQVITVGPVTQGDADAVLEVCRARGLVDAGLYRSEWRDA